MFPSHDHRRYYSLQVNDSDSYIKIPHRPNLNFEKNDDFSVTFYYEPNSYDWRASAQDGDYYVLSKEALRTAPIQDSQETRRSSLSTSTGSLRLGTIPTGPQFPYRVYYKGNHPNNDTASLFFERSDGETTQFVSSSFFTSGSSSPVFVGLTHEGSSQTMAINISARGVDKNFTGKTTNRSQGGPQTLTKECSNQADIFVFTKPNPDGTLTQPVNRIGGQLSQLMIWNKELETTSINAISQSITGTPYIGNIFYDNGFAVITHPSYKNVLAKYDIKSGITGSTFRNITGSTVHSQQPSGLIFNGDGTQLLTVGTDEKIVFYIIFC